MDLPRNLGDVYYTITNRVVTADKTKGIKYYKIEDCKFCGNARKIIGQDKKEINCPRCVRSRPPRDLTEFYVVKRNITQIEVSVATENKSFSGGYHEIELSNMYGYGYGYVRRKDNRVKPFENLSLDDTFKLTYEYDHNPPKYIYATEQEALNELTRRKTNDQNIGYHCYTYCFIVEDETLPPEILQKVISFNRPI